MTKFNEITTKDEAYQYATDWHLPKVPFFRMWEFNCQDEKKCVKLAIALQSVFNGAKETNPFKINELIKMEDDKYLADTSVGNFELNYQEDKEVKVEKSTKTIKEEKEKLQSKVVKKVQPEVAKVEEIKVQPEVAKVEEIKVQQEVAKVENVEIKKGFSLRLFGKEILGWN